MDPQPTPFDQLGGLDGLRALLADFYDRVFADPMIGFLFRGQEKARLIELETQFTARALGAEVAYSGRTMREAHARHPIMRGHFQRRNVLLEQTLRDHAVPEAVAERWLAHTRALAAAILGPARRGEHCDHELQATRSAPRVTGVVEYNP
ncbi:MAG: group 1 truncated hemoglobin [Myxococcales bacterium]|nr:group 1 truncated hemoglobin [Myxococcales bacterium]